jgi:hypothetical protein
MNNDNINNDDNGRNLLWHFTKQAGDKEIELDPIEKKKEEGKMTDDQGNNDTINPDDDSITETDDGVNTQRDDTSIEDDNN